MKTYSDIISPAALSKFQKDIDLLKLQMEKIKGTWIDKSPFMRELAMWYFERKFLNKVKRLSSGSKHS